ncbi:peptidase M1, leukotriene A4 hydrolase [Cryphonectria parasitica EP155]|uniref:Peptidase M1, leukotriene A4 hydrolase n=1 Tax=Cryphonectria parasitica (strain ATCC 38755 / EP155) TaxID=660469 RepID=A0A9P4XU44_CRYP1|nr:peptidase M1, leukotriene A4 hydrolase [Cryphonectria parasitica EP155]KAF3760810.1 peptidase M1, leukotriene A4 hydrolase [Cryphonectria parasitica EP155]
MPPKPDFDTSLIDVCYKLAAQWEDKSYTPSPQDVETFSANQKLVFLQTVQAFAEPLSAEQVEKMGQVYKFNESQNKEVKTAYFEVSLRSKVTSTYEPVAELLGQVGRMKFVRPLYVGLNKVDRPLALATFEKNKDFYHPICKAMVVKILGQ